MRELDMLRIAAQIMEVVKLFEGIDETKKRVQEGSQYASVLHLLIFQDVRRRLSPLL
jgi:hypothetical protein